MSAADILTQHHTAIAPRPTDGAASLGRDAGEDIAISVHNLGKMYYLYDCPQDRLKQAFLWGRKKLYREFWALRDVSFEVRRGEALGIIGRNGAGKSTLLQILAGTLPPTTGEVQIRGRVAALLELGSGFNPEFTGRENVYLNGAILGFSREEMDERFDEIAAFADIGDFIDQPVKLYSSGMFVRLAFAVQACVEPDILIVDEALAVGDIGFQRKCYRYIETLKNEFETTIVLVTHDTNAVGNYCDGAMLLSGGEAIHTGSPKLIIELYHKQIFGEDIEVRSLEIYGDGRASISEIWFENVAGDKIGSVAVGQKFYYCYNVQFHDDIQNPVFGMRVATVQGQVLVSTNTYICNVNAGSYRNGDSVVVCWGITNCLNLGTFFFSCGCSYNDEDRFLCRKLDAAKLVVVGSSTEWGTITAVSEVNIYRS
jgi:ABC-type polysaccharide/polyol phosphate transport system ATPase subunit